MQIIKEFQKNIYLRIPKTEVRLRYMCSRYAHECGRSRFGTIAQYKNIRGDHQSASSGLSRG